MTSNLDIYRAANELVKRHGDDALIEAAMRADRMLERGDMQGRAVWLRLLKTLEELRATEPGDRSIQRLR